MFEQSTSTGILYTDQAISAPPISLVKIHPLVIYSIADAYERRDNNDDFAIGVLLGTYSNGRAIITDCYPCKPDPKTVVNRELHNKLYTQLRQLYPAENIIGYFTFSQRQIDWQDIILDGSSAIHIWMRPTVPPKIDVFSVLKAKNGDRVQLIPSPVEYIIEASFEEQAALSRLAATSCSGSLQASINELIDLIEIMESVCNSKANRHPSDDLIGRKIFVALSKTQLHDIDRVTLEKTTSDIQSFLDVLHTADKFVLEGEHQLSLPLDK